LLPEWATGYEAVPLRIVPFAPTAQADARDASAAPINGFLFGVAWVDQLAPPSSVTAISPVSLTTQAVPAELATTPVSASTAGVLRDQVAPPSVVFRTTPPSLTAHPTASVANSRATDRPARPVVSARPGRRRPPWIGPIVVLAA
jgi:hypothetical protein